MSSIENSEQTTELPHLQTVRDIIRWSYNHGRLKGEFPNTDVDMKVVLDSAESLIASKVREARIADSHHWDSETFAPIIVCIRCATTFQTRGNKPCKGKMAKVALRDLGALQSNKGDR